MNFGKKSGDKGFSLFTPLVGTAVVIISIMVAVVMIQNDIRMSRSLSNSYESSSQSLNAKMIKSTAEAELIDNARDAIYETLEGGIEVECEENCLSKIKKKVRKEVSANVNDEVEIYSGVTNSIAQVTDYGFYDPDSKQDVPSSAINSNIQNALSNMDDDIFSVDYSGEELKATLDPEKFEGYEESFKIGVKKGNNILKVNIVPTQELTVKTNEGILSMLKEAADTYDAESSNPYKLKDCEDWTYNEDANLMYKDGSKHCEFHLETQEGKGKMKLTITHNWSEDAPDSFDETC